jgi:hypothetical protein
MAKPPTGPANLEVSTVETAPQNKLMVIAVDVETGSIRVPDDGTGHPDPYPRVVGIVNEADFDAFVTDHLGHGNAHRPRRANSADEPYTSGSPNQVAQILHTHNSPGCTWVVINGWPFCIRT